MPFRHPIRKTHLVSFPRCGQHLIARGLLWVYPDWIVYSAFYNRQHSFSDCEYVNLQKNHDYDLSLEISPEYVYIVLYRGFVASVLSYYDYRCSFPIFTDNEETFDDHCKEALAYYRKWKAKWVDPPCPSNMLRMSFESVLAAPADAIRKIGARIVVPLDDINFANNGCENAFATFEIAVRAWKKREPKEHKFYNRLCKLLGDSNYDI